MFVYLSVGLVFCRAPTVPAYLIEAKPKCFQSLRLAHPATSNFLRGWKRAAENATCTTTIFHRIRLAKSVGWVRPVGARSVTARWRKKPCGRYCPKKKNFLTPFGWFLKCWDLTAAHRWLLP